MQILSYSISQLKHKYIIIIIVIVFLFFLELSTDLMSYHIITINFKKDALNTNKKLIKILSCIIAFQLINISVLVNHVNISIGVDNFHINVIN